MDLLFGSNKVIDGAEEKEPVQLLMVLALLKSTTFLIQSYWNCLGQLEFKYMGT